MPDVKSTRPDPAGMRKAFKAPTEVPSTRLDEDQPKEETKDGFFSGQSLKSRMTRGLQNLKKKVGN